MNANLSRTSVDTPTPRPGAARPLDVRYHGRTDCGRVRPGNEDQFLIAKLYKALQVVQTSVGTSPESFSAPMGHLFVVADGVGGNVGGERASALAVSSIERFMVDTLQWCFQLRDAGDDALLTEFQRALRLADSRILREARRRPELRGMGTTLTLGYCHEGELFVAHVGDSRCYLMRNDMLYQLTRDHTLAAEMVRRGVLPADQAARHGFRHVITNVVGGNDPGVQVEVHKVSLEVGDRLLLCSDGLNEMVPDSELLALLREGDDPEVICNRLIDRANEAGGKDNITAVVALFDG